jgi:chorismate mutase/prephenate dehydratase
MSDTNGAKDGGLGELRKRIDEIDTSIASLAGERRRIGLAVAEAKHRAGLAVRDEAREREVIAAFTAKARAEGLSKSFSERLAQLFIEESLRTQRGVLDARASGKDEHYPVVAYLGGPGTYSHEAATAHFADRYAGFEPHACRDFGAIVKAVSEGVADYGVLPIENTIIGGISEAYDLLLENSLQIVGEHHQRVEHCLVGRATSLAPVKTVYGHPQALAQCRRYLSRRGDIIQKYAASSTTAIRHAMDEGESVAAVASASAAALFGLNVITTGVADHAENFTRFVIVARSAPVPPQELPCKTSIVFWTLDKPGSLVRALAAFADETINLTKLESRPIAGNPWEEMFFADFEGHINEPRVNRALAALSQQTRQARVLGCYAMERMPATTLDAPDGED